MRVWCLSSLVVCCWIATAGAGEYRTIDDFREVAVAVTKCTERFGSEQVLLAIDIDNTLLAMDEPLGSEQWFDWQLYLLKHDPSSPQLVANSFAGLLEVQGRLFELGRMHPPQSDLPATIRDIQSRGVTTIIVTARGKEFRAATERELARNGYRFDSSKLALRDLPGSGVLPTVVGKSAGTDPAILTAAASTLSPPDEISYVNGIMMVAGRHKGEMLSRLLKHARRDIRAVVFVDNRAETVAGVYSELARQGVDVTALQYRREDRQIQAFQYGDKDEVVTGWNQINGASKNDPVAASVLPTTFGQVTEEQWLRSPSDCCSPPCCNAGGD